MKKILLNSFSKTILCLLVALLSGGTTWAFDTYNSTAIAYAVGEGKVYVSYGSTSDNPQYKDNNANASHSENSNGDHTYYLYAQANTGHYFDGWYTTSDCSGTAESADMPHRITVTPKYGDNGQKERWARFLPKHEVVFNTPLSIPYGSNYTLTKGTSDGVNIKTDGTTVTASNSTNTDVATISGLTITPKAVGTTTITVESAEGATYLAGNGTITINVTAPEGVATAPSGEYTETYKIPSSGYGTYCSQYPINFTTSFTNGETAYTVKEKTETLVRLHQIEQNSIKGGVGFVVKGTPGSTITFRFTNSSYVPSPNLLFGTTAPTYIEYEAAYGMKEGGFHLNKAGVVPAHRAFIPNGSAGSVKALTLEFEEEDPTGIDEFKFEDDSNDVIYNLAGQRINKMQRGINIVNGKKILK